MGDGSDLGEVHGVARCSIFHRLMAPGIVWGKASCGNTPILPGQCPFCPLEHALLCKGLWWGAGGARGVAWQLGQALAQLLGLCLPLLGTRDPSPSPVRLQISLLFPACETRGNWSSNYSAISSHLSVVTGTRQSAERSLCAGERLQSRW